MKVSDEAKVPLALLGGAFCAAATFLIRKSLRKNKKPVYRAQTEPEYASCHWNSLEESELE